MMRVEDRIPGEIEPSKVIKFYVYKQEDREMEIDRRLESAKITSKKDTQSN